MAHSTPCHGNPRRHMMKILALDFDGVICDSVREVFVVSLQTYLALCPDAMDFHAIVQRLERGQWGNDEFTGDPVFRRFLALMPLGNRAEDYGVVLRSIEQKITITGQESYDACLDTLNPSWLGEYHKEFYEQRELLYADLENWFALHDIYGRFTDLLMRHRGQVQYAIATAKDRKSVGLLLQHFGIAWLFDTELIFDKMTGLEKTVHLEKLARCTNTRLAEITFIDDKVRHLQDVARLGVRPVLAGWGYNTQREHEMAAQHDFSIADLDNVENLLFSDADNPAVKATHTIQ